MAEGAFGLSTGLQYVPGTYSETPEIIELAKAAAAGGGLYVSHMRNEGSEIEKAVGEALAIGEAAHCPVHISHIKIDSPNRWGASETILSMMDQARKKGMKVGGDQYAYTAASSGLSIRFPAWALEGGREKTAERLKDPATWEKVKAGVKELLAERGLKDLSFAVVSSYRSDPTLNGMSIKQIAVKFNDAATPETQIQMAREMMLNGGASMVYQFMSEDDIARIMKDPNVSVGCDAGVLRAGDNMPHPRGYGNNARVLGRYVRELKVIPLQEAIRKMTSLPAEQFRIADRGLVKEGYAADLVVFDPAKVADKATYEQPRQFPVGFSHVVVNGVAVMRDGELTGAKPGQLLAKRQAQKTTPAPVGVGVQVVPGGTSR
ncbi:MAG: hypothetical protein EHM13_00320 [Acidobacteria bacterium]|nr:MAG: hypothetical protein EHM13_00320 [Acidobacteriota bacterium]